MIQFATQTREQWLAERKGGIGGSDAAAAIGISPWKSRFQLWSEKVGLIEQPDLDSEAIEWGTRLEPIIAAAYREKTGRAVHVGEPFQITRHPDREWMMATLDATQEVDGRGPGVLQIKTTSAFHLAEWEDEPPLHYQVQVIHEMLVARLTWGTLCVLVGGQKLRWFDLDLHERFASALTEKEAEFWHLVQSETPPEVDGSEATREALLLLYPKDSGEVVTLPDDASAWDAELCQAKTAIKEAEARKSLAENQLKAAIGNASMGLLPTGQAYTFKAQTTHYKAKEACEATYRVLRRKEKP